MYTPVGLGERDRAMYELTHVLRKLNRASISKTFWCPMLERTKVYNPPAAKWRYSINGGTCDDCGRLTVWGAHRCIECHQQYVRDKFFTKVYAEERRTDLFNAVFNRVVPQQEIRMGKKANTVAPIIRSTSGLREALFDEMEALRSGNSNAQRARSVAQMANAILQSVTVEIEYHKYVNTAPGRPQGDKKVVELGTNIVLVQEREAA